MNAASILDNTVGNLNGVSTLANDNDITLTVAAGSLNVTQNVTANGAGKVDLRSAGASSDINLNNGKTIGSSSGTVQLVAGRNITTDSANGTSTEIQTGGSVLLKEGDGIGTDSNRIEIAEVATLAAVDRKSVV